MNNLPQPNAQRWLKDLGFCPACRAPLHARAVADIYTAERLCEHGHHFIFIMYEPALQSSAEANRMLQRWCHGADCWQTIECLLTDREARRILNPQLAEMLSRLLAIEKTGDRIASEAEISFCSLDGEKLEEFQQPDVWVHGLRCRRGHEWFERGNGLWTKLEEQPVALKAEMSDATLRFLIRNWLSRGRAYVEQQLGPEVVSALERFLRDE